MQINPDGAGELQHALAELYRNMGRATTGLARRDAGTLAPSDHLALAKLAVRGPMRLSGLAEACGLDASTTSRRVASLEERGLVRRTKDPSDARASLLEATDDGMAALDEQRRRRIAIIMSALGDWTPEERAELTRLIGRLNAGLEAAHLTPAAPTNEGPR